MEYRDTIPEIRKKAYLLGLDRRFSDPVAEEETIRDVGIILRRQPVRRSTYSNQELESALVHRGIKIPSSNFREEAISLLQDFDRLPPSVSLLGSLTAAGARKYMFRHQLGDILLPGEEYNADNKLMKIVRGLERVPVALGENPLALLDWAIKFRDYEGASDETLKKVARLRGFTDKQRSGSRDYLIGLFKRFDNGEYFPTIPPGIMEYSYILNHGFSTGDIYDTLSDLEVELLAQSRDIVDMDSRREYVDILRMQDNILTPENRSRWPPNHIYRLLRIPSQYSDEEKIGYLKAYDEGRLSITDLGAELLPLYNYTHKIVNPLTFGGYENLTWEQQMILKELRQPHTGDIIDLDEAIDQRNYDMYAKAALRDIATTRGIDPASYQGDEQLRDILRDYDKGDTYTKDYLLWPEPYYYSRLRNYYMGREEEPPKKVITQENIRGSTIQELKEWLQDHGISYTGARRKADYVNLVTSTLREIEEAQRVRDRIQRMERRLSPYELLLGTYAPSIRNTLPTSFDEILGDIRQGAYYPEYVTQTPIDLLMSSPEEDIDKILKKLGYGPLIPKLRYRDKINILWWRYALLVGSPELSYLEGETPEELRQTIPAFQGMGTAAIYFALLHGVKPPTSKLNREAGREYRKYKPQDIAKIAGYLLRKRPGVGQKVEPMSPYQLFLGKKPSPLYPFLVFWAPDTEKKLSEVNPEEIAQSLGMSFPPQILLDGSLEDKNKYFLDNLKSYQWIYIAPPDLPPPPPIETLEQPIRTLRSYDDFDLLSSYDTYFSNWNSRRNLLDLLVQEGTIPKWSYRITHCSNANVPNILTFEERLDVEEDDPLLSYGTLGRHICFSVQELLSAFRRDDEYGFLFGIPTGTAADEFNIEEVKKLKKFLVSENKPTLFRDLITKIDEGIQIKRDENRVFQTLQRTYSRLPPGEQKKVQEYILAMFVLGMSMRFWPGPGNPWLEDWGGSVGDRCDAVIRDRNTWDRYSVINDLRDSMAPETQEFVNSFPRVRYNFATGEIAIGKETVRHVLDLAGAGRFCLLYTADQVTGTAYYLSKAILNLSIDDFNTLMSSYLGVNQPPFRPDRVTHTGHIDMNVRLEYGEGVARDRLDMRNIPYL